MSIPMEEIFANGVFAILFTSLLLYTLKTNDTREKRLLDVIDNLKDKIFDELQDIKEELINDKGNK